MVNITCVIHGVAAPCDFTSIAGFLGAVVVLKPFDEVHASRSYFPVLVGRETFG